MKLLLLLPGCFLLSQPVHGLATLSHRAISANPSKRAASYRAAARRRHPRGGDGPAAAFASPSSRLSFTPEAANNVDNSDDDDDKTPFIRPALHNSSIFRSVAIVYALLFAIYQGSAASSSSSSTTDALRKLGKYLVLPPNAAAAVHLLSFSIWFGTVVYTTFVAGITMFKNLPRRVFGTLQSKLFPLYFRVCSGMIGVQILTLVAMPDVLGKTSEVSLAIAFAATLLNLVYLEPKSTSVMFDRYRLEDEGKRDSEEYKTKAKSFGMLHGMSSLANLVALCGGVIHGVRLASGLAV